MNEIQPEGIRFDHTLALPRLDGPAGHAGQAVVPISTSLRGEARPTRRGVEFRARLRAECELSCSRCLEPFRAPLRSDFFLLLVPEMPRPDPAAGTEETVTADDAALLAVPGGRADLVAIAVEQLYLNLPLKPICRDDCRGLCSVCGADRNCTSCDCTTTAIDPRLAPLARLVRPAPATKVPENEKGDRS